jgi:hypothetical protein
MSIHEELNSLPLPPRFSREPIVHVSAATQPDATVRVLKAALCQLMTRSGITVVDLPSFAADGFDCEDIQIEYGTSRIVRKIHVPKEAGS